MNATATAAAAPQRRGRHIAAVVARCCATFETLHAEEVTASSAVGNVRMPLPPPLLRHLVRQSLWHSHRHSHRH